MKWIDAVRSLSHYLGLGINHRGNDHVIGMDGVLKNIPSPMNPSTRGCNPTLLVAASLNWKFNTDPYETPSLIVSSISVMQGTPMLHAHRIQLSKTHPRGVSCPILV